MPSAALTAEQKQEAATLHVEHCWTTVDIGEHFGVSRPTITRALAGMGVALRRETQPVLRVKQCCACLHFLPVAMFGFTDATRTRRQSWCNSCTNHPKPKPWQINPAPLAQALNHWRA